VGNYYDCRLTLTPAVDPVACPQGFVFSREAILENLLAQKKANKRALAAWEAEQAELRRKDAERAAVEQEAALLSFDRRNHAGASDELASKLRSAVAEEAEALLADKQTTSAVVTIRENEERMKEVRAFWVPGQGPETSNRIQRPCMDTMCPASGKKLRLKDLIDVKFTPVPGGGPLEYMDPISRDPFTNATRLLVIKPTGDVVSEETWRRCIKPEGNFDGTKIGQDDVLELRRGGTGFAEHDGEAVEARRFLMLGAGNGMAPTRGQLQGPTSRFGLSLMN
jgi:nitric oxide synthase-interacting protein